MYYFTIVIRIFAYRVANSRAIEGECLTISLLFLSFKFYFNMYVGRIKSYQN